MAKRAKKVIKDKAQVLAELRNNSAFMDKMKFIKERFYPALCEASSSVEDASQLLAGFNTAIMQEFLGKMKLTPMGELKLDEKLDQMALKHEQMKALLDLFKDMNVFDAKDYIEGMRSEIELFKREDYENRPLSSLKTKWIDEN